MIACHQVEKGGYGDKTGAPFGTITLVQHVAQSGVYGQAVGDDLSSTDKGQKQLAWGWRSWGCGQGSGFARSLDGQMENTWR